MDLKQAQQLAWLTAESHNAPQTSREALGRLQETLRLCAESLEGGQLVTCQTRLEDSLLSVLVAMHTFSLKAEPAFERALARARKESGQRAFHLFTDRLEIRVGGEVRGGWPLASEGERESATHLALELGCDVVHEEVAQLALFADAP